MRITTNFSFPFDRILPALVGLGWGGAALGLVLAAGMCLSGASLRARIPHLRQSLKDPSQAISPIPEPAGMPSTVELSDLRDRLAALNRLGMGGGPSTCHLLARLEGLIPPGVRLASFQNDLDTGGIQLVAESRDLEDLSRFLETVEKDDGFSKVNLTKQVQVPGVDGNWIQFSIDLTGGPE